MYLYIKVILGNLMVFLNSLLLIVLMLGDGAASQRCRPSCVVAGSQVVEEWSPWGIPD